MPNFFDSIKSIYLKNKIDFEPTTQDNIILSKWLSYDKDNLPTLKQILLFIFWINPINYYYLLWLNIPQKLKIPFLTKPKKQDIKLNKLYEKIQHVLDWSDRELELNKNLLDKTILKNRKYWEEYFGII